VDPENARAIDHHLRDLGWLQNDRVLRAEKIGDGNMNLTVRLHLARSSAILKQARPWVEKYPDIPAPVERAEVEAAFYRTVMSEPAIASRMPALLDADRDSHLLLLEDLRDATDLMSLYAGERLTSEDAAELICYLNALHSRPVEPCMRDIFRNREMRALNHAHQYDIPLRAGNGMELASELKKDAGYRERVAELGRLYLADGDTLLHGDYFPGSWLRTARGMFVIDPEFSFLGPAEFDLGILRAHVVLTGQEDIWPAMMAQYNGPADWHLVDGFAGAEIMRRLIGVAQLPLRADIARKRAWLELSRSWVCA
jgi:5-methylthioribose kinase